MPGEGFSVDPLLSVPSRLASISYGLRIDALHDGELTSREVPLDQVPEKGPGGPYFRPPSAVGWDDAGGIFGAIYRDLHTCDAASGAVRRLLRIGKAEQFWQRGLFLGGRILCLIETASPGVRQPPRNLVSIHPRTGERVRVDGPWTDRAWSLGGRGDSLLVGSSGTGLHELWRVALSSGHSAMVGRFSDAAELSVSADGEVIVCSGLQRYWRTDRQGQNVEEVEGVTRAVCSPDGSMVAGFLDSATLVVVTGRGQSSVRVLARLDGRLTPDDVGWQVPAWSPDGRYLATSLYCARTRAGCVVDLHEHVIWTTPNTMWRRPEWEPR